MLEDIFPRFDIGTLEDLLDVRQRLFVFKSIIALAPFSLSENASFKSPINSVRADMNEVGKILAFHIEGLLTIRVNADLVNPAMH